ncbi:MAG: tripartite tricarboxylate transporter substrate binding protein [Acetobacteraceae bacterium]|nr:tripartite tricarboxylate transporter substrate binding protein [Acetobacteraceae bacterium]
MHTTRRSVLTLLPTLALTSGAAAQPQEAYPNRPIRLVVPYTPGGSVDLMARAFGRRWGEILKQAIVVENKPGATTIVGTTFVARAEPDGYTVLSGGTNVGLNRYLFRTLPYDAERDLTVVALLTIVPYLLVVNPSLPVRSVPELIDYAKARPGALTYASFGVGGAGHIAGEMFDRMAGVQTVHVPYNGTAPGLADVMAGRVSMSFATIPPSLPAVRDGRLRALALTGMERMAALPDIPTIHEAALPGFECVSQNLIFAPAATPAERLRVMNETVQEALRDAALRRLLEEQGFVVARPMSSEESKRAYDTAVEKLAQVVREARITIG